MITAFPGDEDLAKTLDIKIIAGSDLTETDMQLLNAEDDSKSDYRFLINETLAKQLGWKPQEAVAKKSNWAVVWEKSRAYFAIFTLLR